MLLSPSANETPITPAKAGLLALLCATWIITGIIGHDPWKPDEAYSFGLIYYILRSIRSEAGARSPDVPF